MYRIKTDIRQYKCETREKVERLIRNWVIRPNDLIYDASTKAWNAIGTHEEFLRLFAILDEAEKLVPDTVVSPAPITSTNESPQASDTSIDEPRTAADNSAPAEKAPSAPPEPPAGIEETAGPDEVTVVTAGLQDADDDLEADAHSKDDELSEPEQAQPEAEGDEAPTESADLDAPDDHLPDMRPAFAGAPKLGRHNLPEDFFATNEITGSFRRDAPVIDDLAELSSEADEEATHVTASPLDEERDEERTSNDGDFCDRDDENNRADDSSDDVQEGDPTAETTLDDDSDGFDDEEPVEVEVESVVDHVADPYAIDLPFVIGPTEDDLLFGIRRTNRSAAEIDRRFPRPVGKDTHRVYRSSFDLTPEPAPAPEPSSSWKFTAGVLAVVVLLLVVLSLAMV